MGAKSRFWQTETGKKLLASGMFLAVFLIVLSYPARADTNVTNCTRLNTSGEMYILSANITSSESVDGYCLPIENFNITLDCQGYTIDSGAADYSSLKAVGDNYAGTLTNITIKNCIFQNWVTSITSYMMNITIKNNTFLNFSDGYAMDIEYGDNVTIENNTINNSGGSGTWIMYISDSNRTTIRNNIIFMSYAAKYTNDGIFFFDGSNDINFYNNFYSTVNSSNKFINVLSDYNGVFWNTTNQSGTRIYSNGTEIGGNYWTNSTANGYSDTCTDLLQDGFCDDPYDVNTSAACAAVADGLPACGNNTDWLPLSAFYVEPPCVPSWNCTDWSACVRGYQTRECTDDNQCGDNRTKPVESQVCFVGLPNATFNITDSCCPISQYYCTDNETLVQLWNTSEGVSWAVAECNYGCDNATSSCAPAPFEANLWTLAIIIGIIVGIALLYRWSKR